MNLAKLAVSRQVLQARKNDLTHDANDLHFWYTQITQGQSHVTQISCLEKLIIIPVPKAPLCSRAAPRTRFSSVKAFCEFKQPLIFFIVNTSTKMQTGRFFFWGGGYHIYIYIHIYIYTYTNTHMYYAKYESFKWYMNFAARYHCGRKKTGS